MSKTLSIYSPRHVLQLYMVPRFKLQLLFPGEIIKVATTYQFIICGRRDANACKRPALQTIQLKRIATGQGCGNLDFTFAEVKSTSARSTQDQGQNHWNKLLAQNRIAPAFAPQKARSGPNYFGPLGTFWTNPHSPVSIADTFDLASHPPWPYTHVCSPAATATAWQPTHSQ